MRTLIKIISASLRVIIGCAIFATCNQAIAQTTNQNKISKKIVFIVTSHDSMGDTGKSTGYNYAEVSHPWKVLYDAGYEIDFVSPKGGKAPAHRVLLEDSINLSLYENKQYQDKLAHTFKPNEVKASDYIAIYFAGGHGGMWDFPENQSLAKLTSEIYENGGIVGAVCHGPAGIVNVKLNNGKYLVDGEKINSFTNDEEYSMNMENTVPFLLETQLKAHGAIFEKSGIKQKHIAIDDRIITGQNPASATGVGIAMKEKLANLKQNQMHKFLPKNSNGKAILIGPEIFGQTEEMKTFSQKLSDLGYLTITLDFYQNSEKKSFPYTNEGRDEGLAKFKSLDKDTQISYIKQIIQKLKSDHPEIQSFGYLGFSSGAYLGYWAATEIPELEAVALVSPGWIADNDFPLSKPAAPILFSKNINGSLLLITGDKDKLISEATVKQAKQALENNNIPNEFLVYPNTKHGFYIKARAETYNENSTHKMWEKINQFFNLKLNKMKKKILFVVTSHDQKGNTGEKTGYYLSEVSHPWEVLHSAGYEIDFVSPKGGTPPVDGFNLEDPTNKKFWEDETAKEKIEHSMKPSDVKPEEYAAIFFAGGHGTMWDLPTNTELANITTQIYENDGVVGAVCHGPAGLVNVKLSNGNYLVDGKKINAFINEEETAVKLENVVPFLLESQLIEHGAKFEKSGLWQPHVTVDERVVTGQNPQSAKSVGEAMLRELEK